MKTKATQSKTDIEYLYKAILSLETVEECAAFFEALCTPLEINTVSQRLAVAKMLKKHEVYLNIVAKTTASTATISRVKRSMDSTDAYEKVFERLGDK
jgi:TrpR-related protein YerC/YecD